MDGLHFDGLTRALAIPCRRSLLIALGTALVAALAGSEASEDALATRRPRHRQRRRRRATGDHARTEGRKKRKRRRKKKPTATVSPGEASPSSPPSCLPNCEGKACGDSDGCGGACTTGSCPDGQFCQGGHCVSSCTPGWTLCAGACVETQVDADHCGGCNRPCFVQPPESCGTNGQCIGGVCQHWGTDTICSVASCADAGTLSLLAYCDGNGICPPSSQQMCSGYCDAATRSCKQCTMHSQCGSAAWCNSGRCQAKSPNGWKCYTGGWAAACQSGYCVGGYCCSSACVAPRNASSHCNTGTCVFRCKTGFSDCNGDLNALSTDGCETELMADDDNCGACGRRCALESLCPDGTLRSCVNGDCACAV